MTDLAYAAGLIDGEGSIGLLKNGGSNGLRRPQLSVGMTDHEPIQAINDALGGFQRIWVPAPPRKQRFLWALNGNPALDALEQLEQFLVITRRRKIARLLIDEYPRQGPGGPPGRGIERAVKTELLFRRMQDLNSVRQTGVRETSRLSPRTQTASQAACAYAAAILDGEGWIAATEPKVEVFSTDPELIAWLRDAFGGYTYKSPPSRQKRCRQTWSWRVRHGQDVIELATQLVPWMKIPQKRDRLAAWL